jgi:hypothetical protein
MSRALALTAARLIFDRILKNKKRGHEDSSLSSALDELQLRFVPVVAGTSARVHESRTNYAEG